MKTFNNGLHLRHITETSLAYLWNIPGTSLGHSWHKGQCRHLPLLQKRIISPAEFCIAHFRKREKKLEDAVVTRLYNQFDGVT